MARHPRLYIPGYPAHVYVRGNDRQAIFRTEGDRVFFHRCLVEVTRRFELQVHAYVFMGNHIHLIATGARADALSKVVQSMGRRYVAYFNYLHGRTGTLWEGRFHSCLVDSDRYFWACHRYVESNPVRAGMVEGPGEHPWSSFRCNALGGRDDLVSPHSLYMELGPSEERRRWAYRRLWQADLEPESVARIRRCIATGRPYGGEAFCEDVERRMGLAAGGRRGGRRRTEGELPKLHSDPDHSHGQGTARTWELG